MKVLLNLLKAFIKSMPVLFTFSRIIGWILLIIVVILFVIFGPYYTIVFIAWLLDWPMTLPLGFIWVIGAIIDIAIGFILIGIITGIVEGFIPYIRKSYKNSKKNAEKLQKDIDNYIKKVEKKEKQKDKKGGLSFFSRGETK